MALTYLNLMYAATAMGNQVCAENATDPNTYHGGLGPDECGVCDALRAVLAEMNAVLDAKIRENRSENRPL